MLPPIDWLRKQLETHIVNRTAAGFDTAGLLTELKHAPASYDALDALARRLDACPLRSDWPHVEPDGWNEILAECAPDRPTKPLASPKEDTPARIEEAFLSAVCGCILGKPLEVDPKLAEIRVAAESCGEWPLNDYVSERLLQALGRRHGSWTETTRGHIAYVAPDDDINYTVLGMLAIEKHGAAFGRGELMALWCENLPPRWTFGPERLLLAKAALFPPAADGGPQPEWTALWNPGEEMCGAAIRVDAYGYACPGHPALAAQLAWRDAGLTHRRTGIYASMFIAAAIATAFVADAPMDIFETALKFVPRRSRLFAVLNDSFEEVARASDWLDGYGRIHAKYGRHGHCQLYQECAQLINTAKFSASPHDAFCKQVMQGCDTDCFGEIIGSIMGAWFEPGALDRRWLAPFHDDLRTALGMYYERSLKATARRMAKLPGRAAGSLSGPAT